MSNFASARSIPEDINKVINGVTDVFRPIFENILGKDKSEGNEYFFARVLLLILLFSIIYSVLGTITFFQDKTWVLFIVGAVVSILGMRGIVDQTLLETILLPSQTLGIALTAGIPFVVYFMIVEFNTWARAARNTAWIFFAVIFIGLWISRYDSISAAADPFALYIYPITALLALLMMIFDGTIQKWRNNMSIDRASNISKTRQIRVLQDELALADTRLAAGTLPVRDYHTEVRRIRRAITALS